mgnify:CR=1 FL=1
MEQLINKKWWSAAATRAIRTIAQTATAIIGTAMVMENVDWRMVASASALSGIFSLLTSLKGLPEVKEEAND